MGKCRRLLDVYQFPGFRPKARIKGVFGDPTARLSGWSGVKKNGVRAVRRGAAELLRQQDAACPGPILREFADLSGRGWIVVSDLERRRPSGLEAKTGLRRAWITSMNGLGVKKGVRDPASGDGHVECL